MVVPFSVYEIIASEKNIAHTCSFKQQHTIEAIKKLDNKFLDNYLEINLTQDQVENNLINITLTAEQQEKLIDMYTSILILNIEGLMSITLHKCVNEGAVVAFSTNYYFGNSLQTMTAFIIQDSNLQVAITPLNIATKDYVDDKILTLADLQPVEEIQ